MASLPRVAAGISLDHVTVFDDQFLAGHPLDDVLQALSKTRQEGRAVFRSSSKVNASIGGTWVAGVTGADLLAAISEHWTPAQSRELATIESKEGWLLDSTAEDLVFGYAVDDIVYLAIASDRATLDALVASLP
jgi:hypothetical protein